MRVVLIRLSLVAHRYKVHILEKPGSLILPCPNELSQCLFKLVLIATSSILTFLGRSLSARLQYSIMSWSCGSRMIKPLSDYLGRDATHLARADQAKIAIDC